MRSFASYRHITPRYALDRFRLAVHQRLNPAQPWFDETIVALLTDLIRPSDIGLEVGAGRSTVWFAERCASLVSVEHDAAWKDQVAEMLRARGLQQRVDLRLCRGRGPSGNSSYIDAIHALPDEKFDFVLIDGRARDLCALAALPKLQPGGLMIVDDVHRYLPIDRTPRPPHSRALDDGPATPAWAEFAERVRLWRSVRRSNGVYETAFWIKPCR